MHSFALQKSKQLIMNQNESAETGARIGPAPLGHLGQNNQVDSYSNKVFYCFLAHQTKFSI